MASVLVIEIFVKGDDDKCVYRVEKSNDGSYLQISDGEKILAHWSRDMCSEALRREIITELGQAVTSVVQSWVEKDIGLF